MKNKLVSTNKITSAQRPIESFINKIICGEAVQVLKQIPPENIDCVVTSPPYFHLRDFGVAGQIGLEKTVEDYIFRLIAVFDEINWEVSTTILPFFL